jgi:hypothetical protein
LRRTIIAVVAVGALIVTGVAVAATLNTYTASFATAGAAGSAKSPAPVALTQQFGAKPISSVFANPLTKINFTISGMKVTTKGFPTCSIAKINGAKADTGCPKGALVATGTVKAELYGKAATTGTACDPLLDVWNGGGGKLIYFFRIAAGHTCGSVATGSVAPWAGTIKQSGKKIVNDNTLPGDVSTSAGGFPGVYSALQAETLKFKKLTIKSGGKTVAFLSSTGCTAGGHAWTELFSATNGSKTESATETGKAKC